MTSRIAPQTTFQNSARVAQDSLKMGGRFAYMITDEIKGTLQLLQDGIQEAEALTTEKRRSRDRYLLHLLHEGHSLRSLAGATGMARQSIMEIRDKAVQGRLVNQGGDLFEGSGWGASLD